ncbi:MAG: pitrilysin family protein [Acidobacteriota bacterium]
MNSVSQNDARQVGLGVERRELSNGLIVLLSEDHSTPSISINAVVLAGARCEDDAKAGLASLVGELIAEGTSKRSSQQIAQEIESVGARLVAFGDYQISGAHTTVLAEDFNTGLDIISDVLMNAAFPQDQFVKQRERRVAQIKSRLDVPRTLASDAFNEIVFRGTPRHRPTIGYENTVSELTRDDAVDFYRRFYVPNNTLLAVVGDFKTSDIIREVERAMGDWQRDAEFKRPSLPAPAMQTEPLEKFIHAPKEQVNIFIGHLGVERTNADYYALLVMDTILGSSPGFTSRIPRILRDEQGLAYSTFSNITSSAGLDAGRFVAYIGTAPENLERAREGLRREIERIAREPVTLEEVESAKSYLTGNFVFDFQTNSQVAGFLIDAEVYHLGFDYLQKYPRMIRAITVEDIMRVAGKHIHPEALTTVVVGPVGEEAKK